MADPIYGLTDATARRLRLLLGEQAGGGDQPRHRPRPPGAVLVRCTSASAAGGSGAAAQCYPAVVLLDESDATGQTDGGACWLTVWSDGGAAGTPTAGRAYPAVLSGRLDVGGDDRQRAFAAAGSSGGGSLTSGYDSLASAYTITANTTWEDTGVSVSLPSAGTYLLTYATGGNAKADAKEKYIETALYDVGAAAHLNGTFCRIGWTAADAGGGYYTGSGSAAATITYEAAGAVDIKLQAWRASATSWLTSQLFGATSTRLTWVKIA